MLQTNQVRVSYLVKIIVLTLHKISSKGYTALHLCVAWGQMECAEVLVSLGADPQLQTVHGESTIDLAARYNRTECANYLNCVGESKVHMHS